MLQPICLSPPIQRVRSSAAFTPPPNSPEVHADRTVTFRVRAPKASEVTWIACGKDDRLMENSRQFVEVLKKNGVRYDFRETEGNHSWPVWRRYLADFAPLLFQERK